ncbi:hypothetical protein [Sulfobacillus thermosulfidooxidans]|uniref:hypothetical protein n=1 Tax=Sulfobacillus thermosulfidooxidans TaxID=28034 RepID=UPI0011120020|nr:hypothetical protein [Sulfobacillus thermosulfidooxidans]
MYTTQELIDLAGQQGIKINRRVLSDWAKRELIAHPQPRGQGRGRGMLYQWPSDTLDRVTIIAPVMKGFHSEAFAVMVLWFYGFDLPLSKVQNAILSTRELFIALAVLRETMVTDIGKSASAEDQADWVSRLAVKMAPRHQEADKLEAFFHIFVIDRPDVNIVYDISRSIMEQEARGRYPTRKEIRRFLDFFRKDIPINLLLDQAAAKSEDEWLKARDQWIHILHLLRRVSRKLELNRADFRLVGYQFTLMIAPLIFLVLLVGNNPQKRKWLASIHKILRTFDTLFREESDDVNVIRASILRRVEYEATIPLRRLKLRKLRLPRAPRSSL